jgi:hypothetical protein
VLKGYSFSDCEATLSSRDTAIVTWQGASAFCSPTETLYFHFEIVQDKASESGCLMSFKIEAVL